MTCLHCQAETSNGLALCERCQAAVSVYLEFFPVYFRNLARWRPGRSGVRQVPGSQEPQGPALAAPDRVMRALDEAGNALTTWARMLADDRGIVPPASDDEVAQVAALCRWFAEHLTSIATLDWCGEFMRAEHTDEGEHPDGIGYHEAKLRRLTENVIPGWYAGACGRCDVPTYVVPGLTWVTCGGCGATTYARDHVEVVLTEATEWIAPPMRLAEVVVSLIDGELSVTRLHKRISKWGETRTVKRKAADGTETVVIYAARITAHRRIDSEGDPVGPKRYRLGDVLDALSIDGATRLDAPSLDDAAAS